MNQISRALTNMKIITVVLLLGVTGSLSSFHDAAQAAVQPSAPSPAAENYVVAMDAVTAAEVKCLTAFSQSRFDAAQHFCRPLARLGSRDAQFALGLMYAFGEGVMRDMDIAREWLSEAARNGSEEARHALQSLTGFSMN